MPIMHGSNDIIIPVHHGHMLQQANPNAIYAEFSAGHNDFPGNGNHQEYWKFIDKLLLEAKIDPSIKSIAKVPATQPTSKE